MKDLTEFVELELFAWYCVQCAVKALLEADRSDEILEQIYKEVIDKGAL